MKRQLLSDTIWQIYQPCLPHDFPLRMLEIIAGAVPALHYSWDQFTSPGNPPEVFSLRPLDLIFSPEEFGEIYAQTIATHPTVQNAGTSASLGVHQPTDFGSQVEWEECAFSRELLRPYGIRHQVTIRLKSDFAFCGVVLNSDAPIGPEQRRLLELLAPHLASAYGTSVRIHSLELERDSGMCVAARHFVALTSEGRRLHASDEALHLLHKFFPKTGLTSSDRPPQALRDWLLLRSRIKPDAGVPLPDLIIRRPWGTLRVGWAGSTGSGHPTLHLIWLVPPGSPDTASVAKELSLTKRQAEVLGWVAEGKRNAEIALILGCAEGTVRKHVENILDRLGVETRAAACAAYFRHSSTPKTTPFRV